MLLREAFNDDWPLSEGVIMKDVFVPTNLLKPKDAAEYLNFTLSALAAWRCRGGGPKYLKVNGKDVRYRLTDLDIWIEERMTESTSQVTS